MTDDDEKMVANIFNNAFYRLASGEKPIVDGVALQCTSPPDPNEDLIQWCRSHKGMSSPENMWLGPDAAAMFYRLTQAYLLLIATDLNEESMENAIVEIECSKADRARVDREFGHILTAIMRTLDIRELVVKARHLQEANLFEIERYSDITSGDVMFKIRRES